MNDHQQQMRVMPVSLLVEGRPCVVVGTGRVAQRKINHLLDSGAQVSVISPDPPEAVQVLASDEQLVLHARRFQETDVEEAFLVFAATNDADVNAAIRVACKKHAALCCAVDAGWREGDFVTPAIVRRDSLSVAISTSGQSCRRSRLVKESLARHLDNVDHAELFIVGTSHNHLSVGEREPFHLSGAALDATSRMLMQIWGVHEFAIINTCNRVELHVVASDHAETRDVLRRLLRLDQLPGSAYYVYSQEAAMAHSARLLAGLLSQTPGENHIVAQVKDAIELATERGWAAGMLQGWLSTALHLSKHIRQVTQPLLRSFEIESLCLDFLSTESNVLDRQKVVVAGTGVIGRGLVECLLKAAPGLAIAWCYHQNIPEVPSSWSDRVTLIPLSELPTCLPDAAAVVCATASPEHLLGPEQAPLFSGSEDVVLVDLSVPRNIDPALANSARNVRVHDLDDLKHWYRRTAADMEEIMQRADTIVAEHRDMYDRLTSSFQGRNAS